MGKLDKHIASGTQTIKDVSEPLGDRVMKRCAETGNLCSHLETKLSPATSQQVLQKGWALKAPKQTTRFPDKVRNCLQEKFDIGNVTGHKADPVQVSLDMRCKVDEQGRGLFTASECLQTQQIRSFFSRLAAAKRDRTQLI